MILDFFFGGPWAISVCGPSFGGRRVWRFSRFTDVIRSQVALGFMGIDTSRRRELWISNEGLKTLWNSSKSKASLLLL